MKTTLIRNGKIVTNEKSFYADLLIEGEVIKRIGQPLLCSADQIIDAQDKYIFPGGIDAHTHMELPLGEISSSDSFETGTRAALFGGTTTIIDFANQTKGNSAIEAFQLWRQKADNHSLIDYGLHVSITDLAFLSEIKSLVIEHGVSSFKTFLAYEKMCLSLSDIAVLLKELKKYNALLTNHAEIGNTLNQLAKHFKIKKRLTPEYHYKSHPEEAEATAIKSLIELAQREYSPIYIVHLSTNKGLKLIRKAQKKGIPILAETCPQYLLLDKSKYYHGDFIDKAKFVMSPPLRKRSNLNALWKGIAKNIISVVATDHCPFWLNDKRRGENDFSLIPNGAPGVENRMELLYSEGVVKREMPLEQLVAVTSTNPAKIFGLYPKKGAIEIGSDADLVLFNPTLKKTISASTHHMNVDYNPYEGFETYGKIETVFLRGKIAIHHDQCLIDRGNGRYLKRTTNNYPLALSHH